METKTIRIQPVGQGTLPAKDVVLPPGIVVADALASAGFGEYQLERPEGGVFKPLENLYDQVADGQKVHAARVNGLSLG
jgi:hypothetical protein